MSLRMAVFFGALMALVVGPSGSALAVTFDLTGNGGNLGTSEFFGTIDGISLTVLGFRPVDPDLPTASPSTTRSINQTTDGLGVTGDASPASQEGDRVGRMDALQFQFTPDVALLTTLMFELGDFDERFALYDSNGNKVDLGNPNGNFVIPGGTSAGETHLIDLSTYNLEGPFFTIVGVSCSPCEISPNEGNRGFRIAGVSVEMLPAHDLSEVPLPAALPMFVGGTRALGAMGLKRRKKRAPAGL